MPNVVGVETYLEAAGVLLALREGISLESLRRPLRSAPLVSQPREEGQDIAAPVAFARK
jgi:hypothetical protein